VLPRRDDIRKIKLSESLALQRTSVDSVLISRLTSSM